MRRVYEMRAAGSRDWREISEPLPSSVVGRALTAPDEVWDDGYGWAYRYREVEETRR